MRSWVTQAAAGECDTKRLLSGLCFLLMMTAWPANAATEAQAGKDYFAKRAFPQAIAHLQLAVKENAEDRESAQLLGLSYYATGRLKEAIPLLEGIQATLPSTEFDTRYLLGVCYVKTQQMEKARAAFAQMLSTPPDGATAHLLLAQMLVRQGLEDQAIPELEKAAALDPRLPMVHFLRGEIHLAKSEPSRGLDEFQKELAVNPTSNLVYWRMGDALARLERYSDAEKALKQAIWLNETFTGPYIVLGQIGLKKGDLELAVGFLERATKMDSNNYQAHLLLGKAYQRMGREDDAKRQFDMSRALLNDKQAAVESSFEMQR
jgi:tetratricopeptide (TPR) repeat protein